MRSGQCPPAIGLLRCKLIEVHASELKHLFNAIDVTT
jgi:hypothetical protein